MFDITLVEGDTCTGCSACSNICPVDAINISLDNEGFLAPIISEEKCIKCHKCELVCPELKKDLHLKNHVEPKLYTTWINNEKILKDSTSGGMFTSIVNFTFSIGGVVYATRGSDNLEPYFDCLDHEGLLSLFRGSRYVQSDVKYIFRRIKQDLEKGRFATFVGCPCQVSGLISFLELERIDTDSLLTVDLICHGVSSSKYFEKFIQFTEEENQKKVFSYLPRSKKNGWDNITSELIFEDGSRKYSLLNTDFFLRTYTGQYSYRESCYKCRYASVPRISDITIGDDFTLRNEIALKDQRVLGLSMISLNNVKAEKIFSRYLSSELNYFEQNIDRFSKGNSCFVRPTKRPKKRDDFFKDLSTLDVVTLDKKYNGKSLLTRAKKSLLRRLRNLKSVG